MIDKILIANRGEIAVRVIRACRELGIRAVAVYSDADHAAMHVRLADEAVRIGPAAPRESYLSIDRVLNAARKSGAQAVHPGYGFLAENAEFARAVRESGLIFIGPSPEAILAMGDKAEARTRMQMMNVPIVPGYQQSDDAASLQDAADDIGYPVLVKAAAGGGGKAMRIVRSREDLPEALAAARREAQHAFGDTRLILEKYVQNARHVEFQVLGDQHGNLVHLFERECSIQRRHQKIIEETPSPLLDFSLRTEMGAAALAAARAIHYQNAGTVEFIVDPETRAFYFLEMNTRLQVEHPITELTTGLDLVQWQIRVAMGEPLRFSQENLIQRGHAIECRVNAEDPANRFLPETGRLLQIVEPQGPGIRVDPGVRGGDQVTIYYDPLLAKLIVHAETRENAIQKMRTALREYVVLGLRTNIEFLQAVLAHPEFEAGRATTTFLEDHLSNWQPDRETVPIEALIAQALADLETRPRKPDTLAISPGSDPFSPWHSRNNFRVGSTPMHPTDP